MVLGLLGCAGDPNVGESAAAASATTPASNIGYAYAKVIAPPSGLTATNVQDALNQCAAVGYTSQTTAEAYTDSKIATEAAARAGGDTTTLQSAEAYTDEHVLAEATTRSNADITLQANIDAESAARKQAVADTLVAASAYTDQHVMAEATARSGADSTLQSNLNAETAARNAAEGGLQSSLNAETAARNAAEGGLQSSLNDETAARKQGDADTLAAANKYTDQVVAGGAQGVRVHKKSLGFAQSVNIGQNPIVTILSFAPPPGTYLVTARVDKGNYNQQVTTSSCSIDTGWDDDCTHGVGTVDLSIPQGPDAYMTLAGIVEINSQATKLRLCCDGQPGDTFSDAAIYATETAAVISY
jgi:hypothetical protein